MTSDPHWGVSEKVPPVTTVCVYMGVFAFLIPKSLAILKVPLSDTINFIRSVPWGGQTGSNLLRTGWERSGQCTNLWPQRGIKQIHKQLAGSSFCSVWRIKTARLFTIAILIIHKKWKWLSHIWDVNIPELLAFNMRKNILSLVDLCDDCAHILSMFQTVAHM